MSELNGQQIKIIPKDKPETGIDTSSALIDSIIDAAQVGGLDVSSIDALSQSSQSREQIYEFYDSMATDDIISSVIDVYVDDTVQTNDKGQLVWAESSDPRILDYVSWLIESLNLDKELPSWAYCLITYGDVYIRFYRKSDYEEDLLFKFNKKNKFLTEAQEKISDLKYAEKYPNLKNQTDLKEDVNLRIYGANDPYIPYVEMVPNPAEMFDLQKFGKTYGYIKAPTRVIQTTSDEFTNYLTNYKMHTSDVEVFDATSFAHGYLPTTTQRQPETVDIYLDSYKNTDDDEYNLKNSDVDLSSKSEDTALKSSYKVRRGQSILYNSFRVWRELSLLEMSALLNRLTRSSLVRIINVQIPDMPREQIRGYIQRLKDKIEQKSALDTGKGMAAYNNPGPIENTIYIPTFGEKGSLNIQSLGGDFDPKSLIDLEYFRDKLFGNLKVPKQFFGFTDDGAGFNGGASLTIISSRYGNTIKKIQNVLCQLVTDIVNLFLIDRGLDSYVNKFKIRMEPPVTQAELDRRQNIDNRTRYINDIMGQLSGMVEDKVVQLKLYRALSTQVINDPEVSQIIQEYIDKIEKEQEASKNQTNPENPEEEGSSDFGSSRGSSLVGDFDLGDESEGGLAPEPDTESAPTEAPAEEAPSDNLPSPAEVLPNESFYTDSSKDLLMEDDGSDSYLPSPDELGL